MKTQINFWALWGVYLWLIVLNSSAVVSKIFFISQSLRQQLQVFILQSYLYFKVSKNEASVSNTQADQVSLVFPCYWDCDTVFLKCLQV